MRSKYLVERTFPIKNSTILVLDKKVEFEDSDKKYIQYDGKKIPYKFVHNDYMIAIDGVRDISGHKIEFS